MAAQGNQARRRLWIAGWGVSATLLVAVLLFPSSCTSYDGPPGSRPSGPTCPQATTLSGLVWPNIYAGFAGASLGAAALGIAAGVAAARRTRDRR